MVKTVKIDSTVNFFLGFFGVFSVDVVGLVFPVCAIERKKW